jgi:hypothetical protein
MNTNNSSALTTEPEAPDQSTQNWLWSLAVVAALCLWGLIYSQLVPVSEWLVSQLPVIRESHLGEALAFFFYDTPKVILLLTLIVFAMGIIRGFFSPGKDPRAAGRPARGRGQCHGRESRYRDAVLLLLGGAPVHRICLCWRASGGHVFLPDRGTHGQ